MNDRDDERSMMTFYRRGRLPHGGVEEEPGCAFGFQGRALHVCVRA